MQRTCDECGTPYEARRITSKYCGSACRTRVSRRGDADPKPLQVVSTPPATTTTAAAAPTSASFDPDDFGMVAITVRTLEAAGRLDTIRGRAAVKLARRLDNDHRETGSGIASLVRQLEKTTDEALVGANKDTSAIDQARDDLRERRARAAARGA